MTTKRPGTTKSGKTKTAASNPPAVIPSEQPQNELTPGPAEQYQLTLSVFDEIGLSTNSIVESPSDFLFHKSRALIDVSDLTLLARKAINVAHFLAAGMPEQEVYVVKLGFFCWMLNYQSRNLVHLQSSLRQAQKSSIQVSIIDPDNPERIHWVSVQLISTVGISDGEVRFRLPPELRRELKRPNSKTLISMRAQVLLKSQHALTLYEYLGQQRRPGFTEWITVDEFRLTLGVADKPAFSIFKALKRNVIDSPIEQINANTDIRTSVETACRGRGRTVTHLRFFVEDNPDYNSAGFQQYRADLEARYETLTTEFGLSDKELASVATIIQSGELGRIDTAIEFARYRIRNSDVKFPGRFLMKAIEDGMRLTSEEKGKRDSAQKPNAAHEKLMQEVGDSSAKQIQLLEKTALEMDRATKFNLWTEYCVSSMGKLVLKGNKLVDPDMDSALENEAVRLNFAAYCEKKLKASAKRRAS